MLQKLKEPLGKLALAADIDPFASEGKFRANGRTKWLVYIWESLALPQIVFTICLTFEHRAVGFRDKRSLQDPHFSCFGYWKNAVQDRFDISIWKSYRDLYLDLTNYFESASRTTFCRQGDNIIDVCWTRPSNHWRLLKVNISFKEYTVTNAWRLHGQMCTNVRHYIRSL